ncbi:hypothetical protein [Achromobacter anxifer]|jgi:hypothetical protein|uniref:hypothetical protein n=1 Tax=Achromobacter anxifer TaxID=1287737 RepID=UPI001581FE98|nr:hypothetical protein [Achromobacter anxifer]
MERVEKLLMPGGEDCAGLSGIGLYRTDPGHILRQCELSGKADKLRSSERKSLVK